LQLPIVPACRYVLKMHENVSQLLPPLPELDPDVEPEAEPDELEPELEPEPEPEPTCEPLAEEPLPPVPPVEPDGAPLAPPPELLPVLLLAPLDGPAEPADDEPLLPAPLALPVLEIALSTAWLGGGAFAVPPYAPPRGLWSAPLQPAPIPDAATRANVAPADQRKRMAIPRVRSRTRL
jgi:hypothetical protein